MAAQYLDQNIGQSKFTHENEKAKQDSPVLPKSYSIQKQNNQGNNKQSLMDNNNGENNEYINEEQRLNQSGNDDVQHMMSSIISSINQMSSKLLNIDSDTKNAAKVVEEETQKLKQITSSSSLKIIPKNAKIVSSNGFQKEVENSWREALILVKKRSSLADQEAYQRIMMSKSTDQLHNIFSHGPNDSKLRNFDTELKRKSSHKPYHSNKVLVENLAKSPSSLSSSSNTLVRSMNQKLEYQVTDSSQQFQSQHNLNQRSAAKGQTNYAQNYSNKQYGANQQHDQMPTYQTQRSDYRSNFEYNFKSESTPNKRQKQQDNKIPSETIFNNVRNVDNDPSQINISISSNSNQELNRICQYVDSDTNQYIINSKKKNAEPQTQSSFNSMSKKQGGNLQSSFQAQKQDEIIKKLVETNSQHNSLQSKDYRTNKHHNSNKKGRDVPLMTIPKELQQQIDDLGLDSLTILKAVLGQFQHLFRSRSNSPNIPPSSGDGRSYTLNLGQNQTREFKNKVEEQQQLQEEQEGNYIKDSSSQAALKMSEAYAFTLNQCQSNRQGQYRYQ